MKVFQLAGARGMTDHHGFATPNETMELSADYQQLLTMCIS